MYNFNVEFVNPPQSQVQYPGDRLNTMITVRLQSVRDTNVLGATGLLAQLLASHRHHNHSHGCRKGIS